MLLNALLKISILLNQLKSNSFIILLLNNIITDVVLLILQRFLFAVKMWVKQDKLEEVFDHFGMIPSFLESLILIEAYGKIVKNQNWFSKELTNKIFNVKHQLDTLL